MVSWGFKLGFQTLKPLSLYGLINKSYPYELSGLMNFLQHEHFDCVDFCWMVTILKTSSHYRPGMGNFDSHEGQDFLSFIPRARLLIHVHTPFTPSYSVSFLLKEMRV